MTVDDTLAGLRRRREASRRLPPLDCCSCSDPWPCQCHRPAPSPVLLAAVVAAADHLSGAGLPPLVDLQTCRALWRHGERTLAYRLARVRGAA
jgi:hypothetical protein